MAYRVLEVQPTPNPNAAKFVLDRRISEQPTSFLDAASAQGHPLASRLFEVPGVTSLLLLGDFVTVNKTPNAKWDGIVERVQSVLGDAAEPGK
jgi:hypothetical protein